MELLHCIESWVGICELNELLFISTRAAPSSEEVSKVGSPFSPSVSPFTTREPNWPRLNMQSVVAVGQCLSSPIRLRFWVRSVCKISGSVMHFPSRSWNWVNVASHVNSFPHQLFSELKRLGRWVLSPRKDAWNCPNLWIFHIKQVGSWNFYFWFLNLNSGFLFFFLIFTSLFIWLCWISVVACGISSWVWALAPGPGIEPGTLARRAWSLAHWTTREVPVSCWEGSVEVLNYNCGFVCLSLQVYQFLLHLFWGSVVWYICNSIS